MTNEEAIKMLNKWGVLLPSDADEALDMAIEALQAKTDGDLISRQDAIETACDKCPISFKEKCEWKDNGHCSMKVALEALTSAELKTGVNANANEIYNYLKERIGDTVDDMKEFDAWFERMVWHVKECNRLAAEPKTGKCETCNRNANNGGFYDGRTRCPIQEHYILLKDGYCHLYEPRMKGADNE